MPPAPLDRRQFHQLAAAAFSGLTAGTLAAGTLVGCGGGDKPAAPAVASAGEKHLCRGLNDCKNQGRGGENACRGQGACATVADSECGGHNECRGLGGCGEAAGANECKGKGGCHVPLMDSAWKTVRERMESRWKESQQQFAAAPDKVKAK